MTKVQYDETCTKEAKWTPGKKYKSKIPLHGPGGSGKSHVVNVVMMYAKFFCENLEHRFTKRTIVDTALSGVAATLIGGETTHSESGLN